MLEITLKIIIFAIVVAAGIYLIYRCCNSYKDTIWYGIVGLGMTVFGILFCLMAIFTPFDYLAWEESYYIQKEYAELSPEDEYKALYVQTNIELAEMQGNRRVWGVLSWYFERVLDLNPIK